MYVCLWPISSGTAGPIWLNFFLLAPSWSRDGFRPKKFRIRDPVFPEIRKNPDFRVLLLYPFFECTIIGRSPETQIAAKPLDASGEAASSKYSFISLLYSCRGKKSIMYLKLVSCPFKSALYPLSPGQNSHWLFWSKIICIEISAIPLVFDWFKSDKVNP